MKFRPHLKAKFLQKEWWNSKWPFQNPDIKNRRFTKYILILFLDYFSMLCHQSIFSTISAMALPSPLIMFQPFYPTSATREFSSLSDLSSASLWILALLHIWSQFMSGLSSSIVSSKRPAMSSLVVEGTYLLNYIIKVMLHLYVHM